IAKDQIRHSYNSGVMAFNKNDTVIREWAKQTLEQNALFASDQDLLTWIIETQKLAIYELHQKYNWNIGFRDNGEAIICHWLGAIAKQVLRNQIVLNEL